MTDSVATTGPRLKAERERRGLSSQKAADELHLDGWVIDALEAEDYQRIGPSVYAKGHLKRYAALLGLPAAEIMAGYESGTQAPKLPPLQTANARLRTETRTASNLTWPRIAGSAAALLLVLGLLWWKPWQQRGGAPLAGPPVAAHPSAATADGTAESAGPLPLSPPAFPASATLPVTATARQPDATAGTGRARLRLSFSADSWVDVHDASGRRVFAGNGRANSVRSIAGFAPMRVYLGFASGVQLEINNRAVAIGPQFVAGDVARFEAGADGILRRDSRAAGVPAVAVPGLMAPGAQARLAHPTG